jgi:RimJ/RimL family protein N-acetyltransferase
VIPPPVTDITASTPVGDLQVRLCAEQDVDLVTEWMNAPHVARFWQQAWPRRRVADYLGDQLAGTVSRPCLGLLDGRPVSYWEFYRAALDPLAEVYPARPHDLGVHVLIGELTRTARGVGSALLDAVRAGLLAADPDCGRIVAEPDVANVASVRAFRRAGFTQAGEVRLPTKTAALMIAVRPTAEGESS